MRTIEVASMLLLSVQVSLSHMTEVRNVTGAVTVLGESPFWHARSGTLFFVDLMGMAVLRYYPQSGAVKKVTFQGLVGPVVPLASGSDDESDPDIVVALGLSVQLASVKWGGPEPHVSARVTDTKVIAVVDQDKPGNRFNDGKADSKGRMWIGTMDHGYTFGAGRENQGTLFRLTAHPRSAHGYERLDATPFDHDLDIPNGMAWSEDDKQMYLVDTNKMAVLAYDFDAEAGTVDNRRVVFDFRLNSVPGKPDGMTIDSDGHLWVACIDGGMVIRVDPRSGKLLQKVDLPVSRVTSVEWGGSELDTLFVSTCRFGLSTEQLNQQPLAGAVFALTSLGARGRRRATHAAVVYAQRSNTAAFPSSSHVVTGIAAIAIVLWYYVG